MAVSKREVLTALSTMTFNDVQVGETTVTVDDFVNFIETSIAQLNKRAEAAAKRANEKKIADYNRTIVDSTPKPGAKEGDSVSIVVAPANSED